jgi:TonB family protein
VSEKPKKSPLGGAPVWLVGGALVIAVTGAGFWFWRLRSPARAPAPAPAPTPLPTTLPATPTAVFVGRDDPLFQAAVQARLQDELKRREQQREKERQLARKKKEAESDRAAEEARKAKEAEDQSRAASDRNDRDEALRLAKEAQHARRRADEAAAAAKAAAVSAVKDGDFVELARVDTEPSVVRSVKPDVPPMARRQKVGGMVLLRVLVNERGQSEAIEILRDTSPKVGLAESSKSAVEKWTWTPGTKDGKKIKTWTTVSIPFVVR